MAATVPASRERAASLLLDALAAACTTGEARLIGSMARPDDEDDFSDIDLRWTIPPALAAAHLESLRSTLHRVGTVESLRVDPEVRPDLRLVFVRFRGWPLWWRVDLEVHAAGLGSVGIPDADPWSPEESACMGVVVTLKALARHRPDAAEELFVHALHRVGATDVDGDWRLRIGALLDRVVTSRPSLVDLVSRTRQLTREVLGE